jgi:hypothetical protein
MHVAYAPAPCRTIGGLAAVAYDDSVNEAPPQPADRLTYDLPETDRNRLQINAALTAIGMPPYPEDRPVIDHLAHLDRTGVETVVRWLRHAHHMSPGYDAAPRSQHRTATPVPSGADPRLTHW